MGYLGIYFVFVGLSHFGVSGRTVNISSAWFLPQEGFPVFYRYFSDKVTWNEAESVCGYHRADLLSVRTSTQMDAARAYLKEIDVTDNIWIGLKKESPEKPFTWTNGEVLVGDGYWIEPIPRTNEKLCAAIDPISDFRWNSFYCRGPQVASFICELPVPEWAKKEDGCMITSLPSLTVTLMPEVGVIQLFSDCGLDGTRRIACKGGVNREEIIKRLSCDVDAFASTIFSKSTTDAIKDGSNEISSWSAGSEETSRGATTLALKTWESYSPLTRHRRKTDPSAEPETKAPPKETQTEKETSTPMPTTSTSTSTSTITSTSTSASSEGRFPSRHFPHSPYLASERNAPSTKPSTKPTAATISDFPSTTKPVVLDEGGESGLPVLIITGERTNESAASDPTSENPQMIFMIDSKEDSVEPYLVPLSDDVILNNPSLSPVEVVNVDLIEFDNLTTRSSAPSEDKTAKEKPETVHPLKLGEKKMAVSKETQEPSSTLQPTEGIKLQQIPPSVPEPEVAKGESTNVVDGSDVPQRPNRGRLLTHSSHPSFYPYFLNRVWG